MDLVYNDVCANPIIASSVELLNLIEEADAKEVAHVEWAARINQCQRVVVMSNNIDSFALLLHFTPYPDTRYERNLAAVWYW